MAFQDTGFYKFLQSPGTQQAAMGLLAAGAPSRMPVNTGQALAQGMAAYQQGALADQQRTLAAEAAKRKGLLETAQIGKIEAETARLGLPAKRETVTQSGIAYYKDTGEKVLPEVEVPLEKKIIKGVDGFNYYINPDGTTERVLPEAVAPTVKGALPRGTFINDAGKVEYIPGAKEAMEEAASDKEFKQVYDLFVDEKGQPHYIEEGKDVPKGFALASTYAPSPISKEQIKWAAAQFNLTGKMASFGRGKTSSMVRQLIFADATRQNIEQGRTPGDVQSIRSLNKALSQSLAQQEKQIGSMNSFVKNLDKQVDRVGELSKRLKMADTRILNVPLRAARQKLIGSPDQAIYEMYLTEIESEIGKLATGSTGSVAELSQGAQERWAKIHDKNMSINDMMKLLEETAHAGQIRMESVNEARDETLGRLQGLSDFGAPQEILEQVQRRPPIGTTMARVNVEGEAPPAISPAVQNILDKYRVAQ